MDPNLYVLYIGNFKFNKMGQILWPCGYILWCNYLCTGLGICPHHA